MKRVIVSLFVLGLTVGGSSTSVGQTSTTSALTLRLPIGARAQGMGEAFVAIADDATATHWNPAGLGLYPLASIFLEYRFPSDFRAKSIALLENDIPEANYKRHDIWAISDLELMRLSRKKWSRYQDHSFPDTLTSIASDGKRLWVGTKKGLFVFSGTQWEEYGQKDGLPSDLITTVRVVSQRSIWVGTDQGIAEFDGAKWSISPFGKDLADKQVVDIDNSGGWAATKSELFKFDGQTWQPHDRYVFKIGDELEKVVRRFLGTKDEKRISEAVDLVKKYNALGDSGLSPGQAINLPFSLAINGEITALETDVHRYLWVGTKWGLKRYADNGWSIYGYRLYTAEEGDDVTKVAEKFLGSGDEERVQRFSQMIMDYNHLQSAQLEPGQKLYVYYNATGSHILSLGWGSGDQLFVGTEYGTVRWDGEEWGRYYHSGLEKAKTKKIIYADGELWFATPEKVVIYAHARREITFMHVNWLAELGLDDLYYDNLAYVQHLEGWGTLGASITYFTAGEVPRTAGTPEVLGYFRSYEVNLALSYGNRLSEKLSAGLTAKLIYSHLSDVGAGQERGSGAGSAFALDAGLLYNLPLRGLTMGVALTNLGPGLSYSDVPQSDPLPRNLGVGLAYRIVDTPFNRLTFIAEANKLLVDMDDPLSTEIKEIIRNVGIEYWYGTYLALRAGYIYDKMGGPIEDPTFGAGLQYSIFRFDFGYIYKLKKDSIRGNSKFFSLTVRF